MQTIESGLGPVRPAGPLRNPADRGADRGRPARRLDRSWAPASEPTWPPAACRAALGCATTADSELEALLIEAMSDLMGRRAAAGIHRNW